MGTDIHSVFQKQTPNGWETIPSNYNQDRHYELFAWLGNIRNGYGFAGTPTHTPLTPLSDNRGLPDDFETEGHYNYRLPSKECLPEWMRQYDDLYEEDGCDPLLYWMGDHSHSYLLDWEILNATPPRILQDGFMTIEAFRKWDQSKPPTDYCRGVWGPDVVVSTPQNITKDTTYVKVKWYENLAESFAYFVEEVRRLHDEHGHVRFVFGFDS